MAKFKPYLPEQGEMLPMYFGDLIEEDHLARTVHAIVEQLDLTEIINQYTDRGEEAYHPRLLIKILFYGYSEGIFSSRKLESAIRYNIPFRWLAAGYQPDHRTISDFRKNNLKMLPSLFSQITQIARELGHVSLGHVSIDGSKIKANASKHKAMSRGRMKKEIELLEKEIAETLEKVQEQDEMGLDDERIETQHQEIQVRQKRLETIKDALQKLEKRKPEGTSSMSEKDQANFTDDDSRIMNTKTQGVIQGYNPQIAVDSDQGFIVGLKMSQNPTDQNQFEGILSSVQEYTGTVPEVVTADAGYFSADNIQQAESLEVDAYIAATKEGKKNGNHYDKSNFTYNQDLETYICPAGKKMDLIKVKYKNHEKKPTQWIYECQACLECPFQQECVKKQSKSGKRTMTRTEADPIRESMRTKVQSDEGKAIYKQRKAIVEPVFGQLKECQGFRQFNLRGKEKVEGEFVLLACSHNLRKLHSVKKPRPCIQEKCVQKLQKAG